MSDSKHTCTTLAVENFLSLPLLGRADVYTDMNGLICNPGLRTVILRRHDSGLSLWRLSPQVHEHLPIYAAGIHEFQNRLDHLQIEQAKLAEVLANDKR